MDIPRQPAVARPRRISAMPVSSYQAVIVTDAVLLTIHGLQDGALERLRSLTSRSTTPGCGLRPATPNPESTPAAAKCWPLWRPSNSSARSSCRSNCRLGGRGMPAVAMLERPAGPAGSSFPGRSARRADNRTGRRRPDELDDPVLVYDRRPSIESIMRPWQWHARHAPARWSLNGHFERQSDDAPGPLDGNHR